MKKILITALCFISVINAADDKKTTVQIYDEIYNGYVLSKEESDQYNFIEMRRNEDATIVFVQKRNPNELIKYSINDNPNDTSYELTIWGPSSCFYDPFKEYRAPHKMNQARALFRLYDSIHAKRMDSDPTDSESETSDSCFQ